MTTRSVNKGFSKIQILIVIAIMMSFFFWASPRSFSVLNSTLIEYEVNTLSDALWFARSQARQSGKFVSICKSQDSSNCSREGGWEQGWLIYRGVPDQTRHGVSNYLILRKYNPLSGDVSLSGQGFAENQITFSGSGEIEIPGSGAKSGAIFACLDGEIDNSSRVVLLNQQGEISVLTAQKVNQAQC